MRSPLPPHPMLAVLMQDSWPAAVDCLRRMTPPGPSPEVLLAVDAAVRRPGMLQRAAIDALVDHLFGCGTVDSGLLGLAWQMLLADPRRPDTFAPVMPQLQHALDQATDLDAAVVAQLRICCNVWWRAAAGEYTSSGQTIFELADDTGFLDRTKRSIREAKEATAPAPIGPHLVVMPKAKSSKLNNHNSPFAEIVDRPLPLVVANDIHQMRAALRAEFPHAAGSIDLLLRDLREGKPACIQPVLLLGPPGTGKSRMVRRLAELTGSYLYRFDASVVADNQFGGTAKAWSNTEASVPARAVLQSRTANPMVMVDEISRAAERNYNGNLWSALLAFTERETAMRYRDQSLDSELDLSRVSYIATANDMDALPQSLRDRFRVVRVPAPTLQHLPALAARVMREICAEDEVHDPEPFGEDELDVMAEAWARVRFSLRSLRRMVSATLEARYNHAPRH